MLSIIFPVLGGLGIFLLGMIIMTDGLKALAGDYMRSVIMKFTRNPTSGAVTGALSTAVLQSSSATTVVAVGFVGAGLLSFSESLGIIFGANIGTTIKGWLVVLVGFKLNLADLMMPVILLGVLLKLFAGKRLAEVGFALAGFGLFFVGISVMQDAMSSLQGVLTPDIFPQDSILGRFKLFFLGVVITVITQSSSAGVAVALTALFAGVINFEQAAAVVIGMDVGTTSTAALATIGGNVSSRRTGLSHVIYNLMTGMGAMLLLSPYIFLWQIIAPGSLYNNAEVALVAFHTTFNLLGVLLVLPFAGRFADFIKKVIPEKESVYTSALDKSLLKDNGMAITALKMSVQHEMTALFFRLNFSLGAVEKAHVEKGREYELAEIQEALNKSHDFADRIQIKDENETHRLQLLSLIHVLDHMQRLHERLDEDADRAETALFLNILDEPRNKLSQLISAIIVNDEIVIGAGILNNLDDYLIYVNEKAELLRDQTMSKIAAGEVSVSEANRHLEAIRWLRRVSVHVHKIVHHLANIKSSS